MGSAFFFGQFTHNYLNIKVLCVFFLICIFVIIRASNNKKD
jgi:YbbR domain-containing protein